MVTREGFLGAGSAASKGFAQEITKVSDLNGESTGVDSGPGRRKGGHDRVART